MSDEIEYREPMVYDDSTTTEPSPLAEGMSMTWRNVPDQVQATKALISISNSLAILADQTSTISPIVAASLFLCDDDGEDDEPTKPFIRKAPGAAS